MLKKERRQRDGARGCGMVVMAAMLNSTGRPGGRRCATAASESLERVTQ